MRKGFVLWLTGLPGSGKTTISGILKQQLQSRGLQVEILDGDEVRKNLSPNLGFSKEDREIHAKRVAYVSQLLARNGINVIVALISPYRSFRDNARAMIGEGFFEVWVKASPETCRQRDPKGLYKKASAGQISNLTGIQDTYEEPLNPELVVDTEARNVNECVNMILGLLKQYRYLSNHD
ncbi:putative adenylylsulfate kinase [Candidatus Nitrososphaera gargensis Ga9.2]|uniref:Adenylyl-sulfate kinase n=1 Tax=Nitrososphaera gargensis (strain Ga9.2) TaxID=1237085 RepID=K0IIF5_NITGG|nr:adenylyl-sulfate kinase [Candidatus Nitrososphaera gargensis]AFU57832.1 putative adenylylsulfate kinase [Candidatus Nitrososphaera gargensis Ga9.2]